MARMGSSKAGRRTRRQFSEEFMAGAVRVVLDEGRTIGAVARELDLTPGSTRLVSTENGKQIDCELRFQGESYGWECQRLHDGELAYGQRFVLREHALAEAEAQRQRLAKAGWELA